MTPQPDSEHRSEIEDRLARIYRSASPQPGFARRLESELDERARRMANNPQYPRRRAWGEALRRAAGWAWAGAGFVLLVAVIVFAVSLLPQRPSALPQVLATQAVTQATDLSLTPLPTLPQTVEPQIELSIPGAITYTVQEGDTLLGISEKFKVSVASLFELNQLSTGDALKPGRVLFIAELYHVVPGDTCASIAFKYGITVEDLVQVNNLNPTCNNLRSDQELVIPVRVTQPTLTPTPSPVYVLAKQNVVNLHAAPGTSYAVVGTLSPGERLIKYGEMTQEGWVSVEYPPGSGKTAWVWRELVIVLNAHDAVNGVPAPADWVRASNPRRDGDKLLVDVCFNLLDEGDWMIRDAVLRYEQDGEQKEVGYNAGILISLRPFITDSEGAHPGERCDVLEFPLGAEAPLTNASLTVQSLEAYPREGQDCQLYMTRVQPLLTARDTGILISCESQPHTGGVVSVTSKPDGMTLEQAQEVVRQAFQDTISLRGPWEFKLDELLSEGGVPPELEAQQSLLAELRQLSRLRAQTYFQGPGWVHVLDREILQQSGGVLPNGKEIPNEYRLDQWYELDENGMIVRTVVRMLDMSGEVLQESVLQEEKFTNLTLGEVNPQEVFYLQPFDHGFTDLAESAAKTNKTLSKQPLFFEGEYIGEQYVIQGSDVRWESVYDPTTGRQLSFSTWEVKPEGLQFVASVVVEVMENLPSAPPEILAYFETP